MLFNSFGFLIFLPIVIFLFSMAKTVGQRRTLLLLASYAFYMCWEVSYIFLILLSTIIDYTMGILIEKNQDNSKKKIFLAISLCSNLGILFLFKYYNFFIENVSMLFDGPTPYLHFLLPVGISFYTFQTMSYSIDIYKGEIRAEKNFLDFALYVTYFPQLVAGPIEKASRLLPQLKALRLNLGQTEAVRKILIGFFKKVVIADRVALVVNEIYGNSGNATGLELVLASYFFAVQIYCDFSGYSDIAIGVSKLFGVDLIENFKRPYNAKGIQEFWRKWHISLSRWFSEYVYLPLGGSRCGLKRWSFNILVVFGVSGLWHGANWTFIVWGLLHAAYIILEKRIPSSFSAKIPLFIKRLLTFHLVCFAWIFFRAESLSHALEIIQGIATMEFGLNNIGVGRIELLLSFSLIFLLYFYELIEERGISSLYRLFEKPFVRASFCLFILMFGVFGNSEFLYFQF